MHKFVLDIVQCNLLLLSAFHEAHVVPRHNGIEVDCSQCSLRQHCLNLAVRHIVNTRILMHAGARIFAKWGYAVIAGNLARVVVETTEVVCIHHQTDSVLRSYARHRGHDGEHLGELFVRLNELGDSLVYLLNFLVEF